MESRKIGKLIKSIDNLIMRNVQKHCETRCETHLSPMQGWIIGFLYFKRNETIYQKDLEKEFCLPKSTLATIIKQLEEKGLVLRKNAEHDSRLKEISLSEKGCAIQSAFITDFEEVEDFIREDIPQEEIVQFINTGMKIKEKLEKRLNNRKESDLC